MRKVRIPRFSILLTLAVAATALVLSAVGDAADEPAKPKSKEPAAPAETPAGEEKKEVEVDLFAPPADDASSQEVILFLKRLARLQPEEQSQEGFAAHFNKFDGALTNVLARTLDDETISSASNLRYQVLAVLDRLGDETAAKRREEFVASLVKDDRPPIAKLGRQIGFMERMEQLPTQENADRQKLIDDLVAFMQEGELEGPQVGLAMQTAGILEQVSPELAVAAYNVFAKHIEAAQKPEFAPYAKAMYGSARRLSLPGHPIEIAGKTVDGADFNITDYKGKVVLVDFWATWCGPCLQELPNVLDNYEKYHEKGFEVVGISLDENAETLKTFLEENKLPWATLYDKEQEKQGFENAIAEHYGITGIPTVILVNQEGNVVSLEARGERLGELLAELLGPPLEKKPEDKPAGDEKPAEEKPAAAKTPGLKIPTKQPLGK
ncbi:MAG: TlpA disulfide reductase family protein [Planctomycetaceae bacterium]